MVKVERGTENEEKSTVKAPVLFTSSVGRRRDLREMLRRLAKQFKRKKKGRKTLL